MRLAALWKLKGQGWDFCLRDGRMILRNRMGDVLADIEKQNNVYPIGLRVIPPGTASAAWTDEHREPTYLELVQCLQKLVMAVTAGGRNGMEVTLMTWQGRLGHASFKTVVTLARSGANGIVIINTLCMHRMSSSRISTSPALNLASSGSVKPGKPTIVSTMSSVSSSRSYPGRSSQSSLMDPCQISARREAKKSSMHRVMTSSFSGESDLQRVAEYFNLKLSSNFRFSLVVG